MKVIVDPTGRAYGVVGEPGGGVQGQVYPCERLGQRYAIKERPIDDGPMESSRMFVYGNRIHPEGDPNVVRLYDAFNGDGVEYIVMELCDGSLDKLLSSPGCAGTDWVLPVARAILPRLIEVHTAGAAHGDLHVGNVLFAVNGDRLQADNYVFKLADYGFLVNIRDPGWRTAAHDDIRALGRMLLEVAVGSEDLEVDPVAQALRLPPPIGKALARALRREFVGECAGEAFARALGLDLPADDNP